MKDEPRKSIKVGDTILVPAKVTKIYDENEGIPADTVVALIDLSDYLEDASFSVYLPKTFVIDTAADAVAQLEEALAERK